MRLKIVSACNRLCRCIIRVLAWLPVVFVSAIILWGYYVYVYIMNISGTATFFTLVSHLLLELTHSFHPLSHLLTGT